MRNVRIAFASLAIAGFASGTALAQATDTQQGNPGQSAGEDKRSENRVTPQEAAQPGQQVEAPGFGGERTQLPGAAGLREQMLTQKAKQNQSQQQSQQAQQQGAQQGATAQQGAQPGQEPPEGFVLVQERFIVLTVNEPQNHFLRAQQFLGQNDSKAAAGELRVAAAYIDMLASRGRGQADSQLTQSASQIRQLAGRLGQQQQGDGQQHQQKMGQAFAQANTAIAKHLQSLAQQEMQNQKNVMAGHDLEAAAESLAAAYAWSGQQPPQEVTNAIEQSQTLAMQLMTPGQQATGGQQQAQDDAAQIAAARMDERGGAAPQDASKTIDQLSQAIEQAHGTFQASGAGSGAAQGQSNQQGNQQGQQPQQQQ